MIDRFEHFTTLIKTMHRTIQKMERQELSHYGYKGSYAQYLVILQRYPEGITMRDLCTACGLDKAAVSRAISEMEYQYLVERTTGDDRNTLLLLTDNGRKVAKRLQKRIYDCMKEVTSRFSEGDRVVLLQTLETIDDALEQLAQTEE